MGALSNEEREKLVRTSLWNGIGTGIGIAVAGGILSVAVGLMHKAGWFLSTAGNALQSIGG